MKNTNKILAGFDRVAKLSRRLGNAVVDALGPEPEWMKKKSRVDREFDQAFGVSTGGITQLKKMRIAGNSEDGTPHIASDPDEFRNAVDALNADVSQFTFVDLGAGKGRALLLAARHGFRKIIGVEFSRELVEIAERNIRAAFSPAAPAISIIEQDAATYELPDDPIVLFMYNPFGPRTMEAVARRTRASLEKNPRPLRVLYLNPFHLEGWIERGFSVDRREHFAVLDLAGEAASARAQHPRTASGAHTAPRSDEGVSRG
jgi:SAM-dependent methyltransferase